MNLISRYILQIFLSTVLVSLLAFVGIFYIVDLIQQLDRFLDRDVTALSVIWYYIYFTPYIVVLTLPVSMLMGSLFTFGQLGKYGELTAMKASGLSVYRMIRPILLASCVVSLGIFAAGEWLVPEANQRRTEINRTELEKRVEGQSLRNNVQFRGENGRQYFLRLYNGARQRAQDVFIVEFQDGAIVKTIYAESMAWEKKQWVLRQGIRRLFQPRGALLSSTAFEELPNPVWQERPADFQKGQKRPEDMNYGELKQYIQNVRRGGGDVQGYLVDLNLKMAFPCTSIIIVLFGGALASHVRRSGAAMGFAMSIGICFLYWGLLRVSQAFGHADALSPAIAAWGPNIIFGLLGIILLIRAPK